jgi:hypothetical protein
MNRSNTFKIETRHGQIRFILGQLRGFRPEAEHLSALACFSSKRCASVHGWLTARAA